MRVFLTFGDGSAEYLAAGRRVAREAARLNIFHEIIVYNFKKLRKDHPDYWNKNEGFFFKNKRGAGYWAWKSFIIKETLKKLSEDDVLFYADAGCEIDARFMNSLAEIDPDDSDMTLFELPSHTNEAWTNAITLWTNAITLKTLGAERQVCEANQFVATVVVLKNNSSTRSLVNDWEHFCSACDHAFIIDRTDSETAIFKEHRHDQSILSILARKSSLQGDIKIRVVPYTFINTDGTGLRARRNRTGYSTAVQSTYIYKKFRRLQLFTRRVLHYGLSFIRR